MDLAYVDKLPKDNNCVKYVLVRQDLFDRTVDAKRKKTKDSNETVLAFFTMITKKELPQKIGWTMEQILLESLKNYAKLKEYKFTLYNEWDQDWICWTYKRIPEKYTLLLHGRQWLRVHSQIDSFRYNTKF